MDLKINFLLRSLLRYQPSSLSHLHVGDFWECSLVFISVQDGGGVAAQSQSGLQAMCVQRARSLCVSRVFSEYSSGSEAPDGLRF